MRLSKVLELDIMLHHAKVMHALTALQDELFADDHAAYSLAMQAWQQLARDELFQLKAQAIQSPWLIPQWQGQVDAVIPVTPYKDPYRIISVDGSQIYPDRHQGTSCYLINIGFVDIIYGGACVVRLDAQPYLFGGRTDEEITDNVVEVVNAKRQELEFSTGLQLCAQQISPTFAGRQLFVCDGSLIFWHLNNASESLKTTYMACYIELMRQFYAQGSAYVGYISMPKSKELVNLIRIQLCNFQLEGCTEHKIMDQIVDTTVASFFLQPGSRTTLFRSNASILKEYPAELAVYFFYMDVGQEIARVELPAWVAADEQAVNAIASILFDQAQKGSGYPIAIAEAHEQAVVKGPDRDFFYQMVAKLAIDHKRHISISQKSARKRMIGV
jgi:hypothetical protein